MKKIVADQIVNIVDFNSAMLFNREPHYGDYKSEAIIKTTPCAERKGHYFNLRTGQEVQPRKDSCVWKITPGTVLRYADGNMMLITRFIGADRSLGCGLISPNEFNPQSMVMRDVIDRPQNRK